MSSETKVEKLEGVAIVGAGLAGCLLAVYLRRRGIPVDVFDSRPDMRKSLGLAGRSINLVLTSRGLDALSRVDLLVPILKLCTPVYGRTLHMQSGEQAYQAYGPDDSFCNYSISRAELNVELIKAADAAGAKFHFEHPLDHLDVDNKIIHTYVRVPITPSQAGAAAAAAAAAGAEDAIVPQMGPSPSAARLEARAFQGTHVFATDGAGSRSRQALKRSLGSAMRDESVPLGTGYKELLMPLGKGGKPAIDMRSLHIWPRGSHFLMALPNTDGSFTMTLYLPEAGPISFASITTPAQAEAYFAKFYPDALAAIPDLKAQWGSHPQGFLGTVDCGPWNKEDKLVLLGDAAHAITPFFGQGCNAAFEGVRTLDSMLTAHREFSDAFDAYSAAYKPNSDAIAGMAVENYSEMMDKTGDKHFLLQKELEVQLNHKFPETFLARYALVTHTLVPYAVCRAIGVVQQSILDRLCPKTCTSLKDVDMALAKTLVERDLAAELARHGLKQHDFRDVSRELLLAATKAPSKL